MRTFAPVLAALILVPPTVRPAAAHGQSIRPPTVITSGQGSDVYVLLSGMVGGVAGFRRLESRLAEQGKRVIIIDPYQLSIDSPDVSFDALARRVGAELATLGVTAATVIGHAHGGGVAIRLAANSPRRVSAIYLLDVGALAVQRSPVFTSSLRLVPFIARLPRGKGFIRNKLLAGLRDNSGQTAWLDDATSHAYTQPVLDHIGRVVAFAMRLAAAEEPEALPAVLNRIRVPITLLLGEVRGPAGPGEPELTALKPLGDQVRVEVLPGVGHFPHEEAPEEVARRLGRANRPPVAPR